MASFRGYLDDCDLFYMGFSPFTWTNHRKGIHAILERLDKFLKTVMCLFPNVVVVFHLARVASDHCPILLDTEGIRLKGQHLFHFEAMWGWG